MKKCKIGAMLGLAVLVFPVTQAALAADCGGLIGKWRVSNTPVSKTFTDTLTIRKVSSAGAISGVDDDNNPIHGDCRNNTVFLIEDQGNDLLKAWNFTSAGSKFARFWGIVTGEGHDFESVRVKATARKISNSTRSVVLKSSPGREMERASQREQLEEYLRSRGSR